MKPSKEHPRPRPEFGFARFNAGAWPLRALLYAVAGVVGLNTARGQLPFEARQWNALAPAPLYFEANRGQAQDEAQFVARGRDCNVLIAPTEAVLVLGTRNEPAPAFPLDRAALVGHEALPARFVRIRLEGANPRAGMAGREELPGKANYYIGNDPAGWQTGISLFPKVEVDQVYPGVRLIYYADDSARLEYDFLLQPEASPDRISLRIEGVEGVRVDAAGNLALKVGDDEIRQHKPVIYQVVHGVRKQIEGGYVLKGKATAGFRVGAYDRSLPLVIDPVVSFSAYIGGKLNDKGWGVAVDGSGNVWVVGETLSPNLRTNITTAALQPNYQGGHGVFGDAFVARFANGTNLSYLTYLGGKNEDAAFAVAVDTNTGAAFVTGYTDSGNFPIFPPNVFQTQLGGTNLNGRRVYPIDAFVTKLDTNGALVYSTYLGGNDRDVGLGIAVDTLGRAYVTGMTESSNFPTVNALHGPYLQNGDNYDGSVYHRNDDAFVARLNPGGTALEYYTYLGSSNLDVGQGIAVDSACCAYVAGMTSSTNFPITTNALLHYLNTQTNRSFYTDGFVSKLSSNGDTLVYSTYLGGSNNDAALAIAVDADNNAYVTGYTYSTNFPVTLANFIAYPSRTNMNADVFVTKFDPAGTTNNGYSVVFGGRLNDQGIGIAVDANQNAYIVGITASKTNFADTAALMMTNFFEANPDSGFSQTNTSIKKYGINDAFLVELAPNGTNVFSAYLGGPGNDQANGIALDLTTGSNVIAYIVGTTTTTNFPGTAPFTFHGGKNRSDAFVSRIQFP